MNVIKALLFFVFATGLVSCVTSSRVGPEFEAGRMYARDVAKEDAWEFNCFFYPAFIFAGQNARKYTDTLKRQGKSQTFIEGFYHGYEMYFCEYLNVKCGE
jgi:hypothetical protein